MGRILAIDFGKKRIGIAVTDELQLIANPLTTVPGHQFFEWFGTYNHAEKIDRVVVGKPMQMDYSESEAEKLIRPFLTRFARLYPGIPVERTDERFTSLMASRTILQAGLGRKQRQNKELVDAISACIILQTYMESRS